MQERRARTRHRPEPWTLVWVPLGGKPSRALSLGAGLRRLLGAMLLFGALGFTHSGYELHGAFGLWGRVPLLVSGLGLPELPSSFFTLGRASDRPSQQALRRSEAARFARQLGLGTRAAAGRLLAGTVDPAWLRALEANTRRDATLLWPVRDGWYVRGWGSGSGAYHLAVDIQGAQGSPVHAAADGLVGYAGDEVSGYGNLLLVLHRDGLVTLYAHNRQNLVSAGERVRRGQPIAELGSTGISRGPHVHFELLHAGKNCDPAPLFRPGVRHRPGHLGAIQPIEWPQGSARPEAVRCDARRQHPGYGEGELASGGGGDAHASDGASARPL
jgi:hypothetical protein